MSNAVDTQTELTQGQKFICKAFSTGAGLGVSFMAIMAGEVLINCVPGLRMPAKVLVRMGAIGLGMMACKKVADETQARTEKIAENTNRVANLAVKAIKDKAEMERLRKTVNA